MMGACFSGILSMDCFLVVLIGRSTVMVGITLNLNMKRMSNPFIGSSTMLNQYTAGIVFTRSVLVVNTKINISFKMINFPLLDS